MRTPTEVDVVVVGLGVVGLACARELARRGLVVVALEAANVGHAGGSSKGDARMRVPAAFPDDDYLVAGLHSGAVWRDLEAEAGQTLLVDTGCLSWGEGQEAMAAALGRHDVAFDTLSPAEALERHGATLPREAIFQPDAQTILADRALQALARSATSAGADLRERTPVSAIGLDGEGAVVSAGGERLRTESVVVAAGSGVNALLRPLGIALDVEVTTQTTGWFATGPDATRVGLVEYGAPDPYALWTPSGRKAALHQRGADLGGVEAWVRERLATGRLLRNQTCHYTMTADERFVLERHGPVVAVSACSGHGFQHAPDTARRAAEALTTTTTKGTA